MHTIEEAKTTGNEFKDCFNDGVDTLEHHLLNRFDDKKIKGIIKEVVKNTKMKDETMSGHPIKPKRRPANKKKPKKKKK